jgi:hypothetical protein
MGGMLDFLEANLPYIVGGLTIVAIFVGFGMHLYTVRRNRRIDTEAKEAEAKKQAQSASEEARRKGQASKRLEITSVRFQHIMGQTMAIRITAHNDRDANDAITTVTLQGISPKQEWRIWLPGEDGPLGTGVLGRISRLLPLNVEPGQGVQFACVSYVPLEGVHQDSIPKEYLAPRTFKVIVQTRYSGSIEKDVPLEPAG